MLKIYANLTISLLQLTTVATFSICEPAYGNVLNTYNILLSLVTVVTVHHFCIHSTNAYFVLTHDQFMKLSGCWLVDGPVLLAQIGKKFIMVRSLFGANANTFEDDDQLWDAQLLNFDKIDKSNSMRVIYYGELELFSEPALLLCIHFPDETEFDLIPCNNRSKLFVRNHWCISYSILCIRRKCFPIPLFMS